MYTGPWVVWRFAVVAAGLIGLATSVIADEGRPAGLEAALELDDDSYVLGQPILFVIRLHNKSKETLRARLPKRRLSSFRLHMAFGDGDYREADWREFFSLRDTPMREFKPGEQVGASGSILLRGRDRPAPRLAREEGADLTRWLVFDRPGRYRLRATVSVTLGKKVLHLKSNEARFEVGRAGKGCSEFIRFAVHHVGSNLEISNRGYQLGEEQLRGLQGTPYQMYLEWAMVGHYMERRMDDESSPDELCDEEKGRRKTYRRLAEGLLAKATPRHRRALLGERALVYLTLYHLQAGELERALGYAKVIRDELPWSRHARAARQMERAVTRKRLRERTESGNTAKPTQSGSAAKAR